MEEKLHQMRHKANDLSDIVLEKDSKKTESTKKWLLTAASMILLFLIILIIMKMLNKQDIQSSDTLANVGESVETLNPADMQEDTKQESENLFKKEPIIDETSETDLKFEEMVRKLKEQDAIKEPVVEKVAEAKEEVAVKEVKPREIQPIVDNIKNVAPPVVQKAPAPKSVPDTKPAPVAKVAPKNNLI